MTLLKNKQVPGRTKLRPRYNVGIAFRFQCYIGVYLRFTTICDSVRRAVRNSKLFYIRFML